jgi:hypothetical protein
MYNMQEQQQQVLVHIGNFCFENEKDWGKNEFFFI